MSNFVLFVLALLLMPSTARAYYNAFPPSEGPYVSYAVSEKDSWIGEDFEEYADGDVIACSNTPDAQDHVRVTSGCLQAVHHTDIASNNSNSTTTTQKLGYTDDRVFRMLTVSEDEAGRRIKWTDQSMSYRAYITEFASGTPSTSIPAWSGLHVFFRYRTSDDLYVASIRYDGKATLKKKQRGTYTTLAWTHLDNIHLDATTGKLQTNVWKTIKVTANGQEFRLFLDDQQVLSSSNSATFSWGTTGVRTDYCKVYLDDLQMSA